MIIHCVAGWLLGSVSTLMLRNGFREVNFRTGLYPRWNVQHVTRLGPQLCLVNCRHTCASVTKQYNLVPAVDRWCLVARKVWRRTGHMSQTLVVFQPQVGSGVVIIDRLHFMARFRTRRLNQALSVLSLSLGLYWVCVFCC